MMGETKRSRLQKCFNVLEAIKKGAHKPTTIMQDADLSWDSLFEIFAILTSQGLVEWDYIEGYKRYTLTDKGLIAVTHYSEAINIFDAVKEAQTLYA